MAEKEKITPYAGPAGGWGALISSGQQMLKNRGLLRGIRSLLRVNQPNGFDCPGCAWPDASPASPFEFCENGVKAITFETTAKRVGPEFFAQHTVASLRQQSGFWLENQGRLTHPMRYNARTDRYEPIAWAEAFKVVGDALRALASPHEALFYTSGRTSNEAAFLYQLFGRRFGTNNFPDCSNMCHESSGSALSETIGVGKGTVTLEDFDHADAIFVIGQNPGSNHPRMLTELQKASERGAKVVAINPLKERGLERFIHPQHAMQMITRADTRLTSLYLQVLVGGDLAALKGIMKHLLDASAKAPGLLDRDFIAAHTTGFEDFAAQLMTEPWEVIETQSGLTRDQLKQAADMYANAKNAIICWAMGLTQNKHAVATIQQVVNLLLLRGNLGRPGAGACPVRGHSNVQGDRTMGITERPAHDFLDRLGKVFDFTPPHHHGFDVVDAINAMAEGRGKVFIGMGGNFAAATPDTPVTEAALAKCLLTVQIATKLNRTHLAHGRDALLLPCLGRTECDTQASGPQRVTVEDSMSMVHASEGVNEPASPELLSECAIVAGIAKATLGATNIDWDGMVDNYDRIREKIEAVIPGFENFNARIAQPGGFYLGNAARDRQWHTGSGKAQFTVAPIPNLTLPAGQLRMMTIRTHDQYNTTVYDMDDRYRGIYGTRRVILLNAQDIAERSLADGDLVDVTSHTQEDRKTRRVQAFRVVAYDIPPGCAAMYFPEANPLVSKDSFANVSRTPSSKFVPVSIARTQPA